MAGPGQYAANAEDDRARNRVDRFWRNNVAWVPVPSHDSKPGAGSMGPKSMLKSTGGKHLLRLVSLLYL
jgi:hypothetical protein